jgi:putative FmdB family regulatory protein
MPIYEYRCQECQQIFEQWQKDFSTQDKSCPVCGNTAQRLISNTSFVLKGSGWYVTDYCKSTETPGGNGKKIEKAEVKAEASKGSSDPGSSGMKSGASSPGGSTSE